VSTVTGKTEETQYWVFKKEVASDVNKNRLSRSQKLKSYDHSQAALYQDLSHT